jgi:hypothetical protein
MNDKKRNRRSLRQRYMRAQKALFVRAGITPRKAEFLARQEADKICKVTDDRSVNNSINTD